MTYTPLQDANVTACKCCCRQHFGFSKQRQANRQGKHHRIKSQSQHHQNANSGSGRKQQVVFLLFLTYKEDIFLIVKAPTLQVFLTFGDEHQLMYFPSRGRVQSIHVGIICWVWLEVQQTQYFWQVVFPQNQKRFCHSSCDQSVKALEKRMRIKLKHEHSVIVH